MANKISKESIIIIAFALLKLCIHLFTNTNYDIHRDAFLYYSLGEHLDWGYMSVPPFIAVMSRITTSLFGETVFALRIFPALIGSLSVVIIAKIVKQFGGGILAIIIAVTAFIFSPAFLRSNTLFQPTSFNQFFWLLSGYFIIRLIKTQNPKIWISLFIVFGIGFLTKYSIAFFIVSFLVSMLYTSQRKLLISKYYVIGGLIGLFMILPNLYWQNAHNWPLIHHMNELQKYQFVNVSISGFILDQFIMNLPGLIVWTSGLVVFMYYKSEKKFRIIIYMYLVTILILIAFRGKSYYTLGFYPILFAMGGYAIDKYFKPIYKILVIVFIVIVSLPLIPFSIPVLSFEKIERYSKNTAQFTNRWEDGKIYNIPQDFADMTGWRELGSIVSEFYNSLSKEEKNNLLIFADNYGHAGAINFYGKKYKVPTSISFNDSFILWAPDSINNRNMIYVNNEIGDINFLYDSVELIGQVNNKYFRENGLQVYYCTHPTDRLNGFYADKVFKLKGKFIRTD